MANYPNTLPGPMRDGYAVKPTDTVVRTEMDTGHARARRRSVAKHKIITCTFKFTDAQLAVFDDWFNDDNGAAAGAGWFDIPLNVSGTMQTYTCRFVSAYEPALEGQRWRVSARIEVQAYA